MTEEDLVEVADHSAGYHLVSSRLGHIRLQVLVPYGDGHATGRELSVGNTLECHNWEKASLSGLDVFVGVPERFRNTGDAHKTVFGAADCHSGNSVVDVGGTVFVD